MIIGAGGHALSVLDSINKEIYSNISFLDDKFPNKKKIINYEIIGNISSIEQYKSNFENIFIAIGNNQIRFEIFKLAKKIGFNIINIVSKSASISDSAVLGMGNIILHNSVLSYGCKIGDPVNINNYAGNWRNLKVFNFPNTSKSQERKILNFYDLGSGLGRAVI